MRFLLFSTLKPPLLHAGCSLRLQVGGFGLGHCWGWQNESRMVKHREGWRLQQPPRQPPNPPLRRSACTKGSICRHYRSWRSKFSQLSVVIASSFACVASDVLGPAAGAHISELTLFCTQAGTHTGPHTHTLLVHGLVFVETAQAASSEDVSGVCEGLFPFEYETGGDFMDHHHTHRFIVFTVMWWPQVKWN